MIQARSATTLSSVRRLTFEAYRRAEAMGLVDPAPPTEEFDITGVKKVLQGVRDAGIARSPMIELESIELGSVAMGGAEAPESGDLAELMKMVIAALEASPAPSSEWRSVSRVFDAESLAPLLGISVSSLRRYQAGTRATPDEVAARLHFLALVISDLAGAYNEIGVRRWFHRERSLLDGKTPAMLLSGEWNPEDEGAQRVRDLARSLVMLSST